MRCRARGGRTSCRRSSICAVGGRSDRRNGRNDARLLAFDAPIRRKTARRMAMRVGRMRGDDDGRWNRRSGRQAASVADDDATAARSGRACRCRSGGVGIFVQLRPVFLLRRRSTSDLVGPCISQASILTLTALRRPATTCPLTILYTPPSLPSHHFFSLSPLLDALAPLDEDEQLEREKYATVAERMRLLRDDGRTGGKGKGKGKMGGEGVMEEVIECVRQALMPTAALVETSFSQLNQAQEVHNALHSTSTSKGTSSLPATSGSSTRGFLTVHPDLLSFLGRSAFGTPVIVDTLRHP